MWCVLQCIFAGVYITTQAIVMAIYRTSGVTPPWALLLLTLSKRMHSLYVLRLFNDCWTMMLAWAALYLLCQAHWITAIFVFSAAVSIKMNVLLMAPPVLAVCLLVCSFLINAERQRPNYVVEIEASVCCIVSLNSAYLFVTRGLRCF